MVEVLFVRHAETDWNKAGRIQGHADTGISAPARAWLEQRRLPERFAHFAWVSSPLARARQTAELLGVSRPQVEKRLVEMDWGEWEGSTLAALRETHGARMRQNEARGLDFRPCGGESPREVCQRLHAWLRERAVMGRPLVAVTHKGVIRCALALATQWPMLGKPPVRLAWDRAHLFGLAAPDAALTIVEPNIELERK